MNRTGYRALGVALVTAASALALSGCSLMIPVGPETSEERDIGEVSRVVLDTSGDLVVSEGEPALTVRAPAGVIERLTSEVDGDTLVLAAEPGFTMGFGDVRYELTVPQLELVDLNGSGDVEATVSTDGTVQLDLDGSGDVDEPHREAGLGGQHERVAVHLGRETLDHPLRRVHRECRLPLRHDEVA